METLLSNPSSIHPVTPNLKQDVKLSFIPISFIPDYGNIELFSPNLVVKLFPNPMLAFPKS